MVIMASTIKRENLPLMNKQRAERMARAGGYKLKECWYEKPKNSRMYYQVNGETWNPEQNIADCFALSEELVIRYAKNDLWGFFVSRTDDGYQIDAEIIINGNAWGYAAKSKTLSGAWCDMAEQIGMEAEK